MARQAAPPPAVKPAVPAADRRAPRTCLAAVSRRRVAGGRYPARRLWRGQQISDGAAAGDALLERQALQPERQAGRVPAPDVRPDGRADVTTMSAAGFSATPPILAGIRRISRKCSTTTRISPCSICAQQRAGQPRYREVARGTLDFMRKRVAGSRAAASTAARRRSTRPAAKGRTYLWEPDELKQLLSPSAYAAARRVWRLDVARTFRRRLSACGVPPADCG
jgi:uncharacterized protein